MIAESAHLIPLGIMNIVLNQLIHEQVDWNRELI